MYPDQKNVLTYLSGLSPWSKAVELILWMNLGRNWLCWTGITALARSWEFYRNFFTFRITFCQWNELMWDLESRKEVEANTLWLGQSDTKMLKCLVCPSFFSISSTPHPPHPLVCWLCWPTETASQVLHNQSTEAAASTNLATWHFYFGKQTCRDSQVFQQAPTCPTSANASSRKA